MTNGADPYAGMTLEGGFRTVLPIGKGMFARVYSGLSPMGEQVAVKILVRRDDQAERRFYREIKVQRALPENPNCVGYRGHGKTEDGAPWLAMEFVDGLSLRGLLKPGKALPPKKACALMMQLCEGFAELHKLGLAHRDIKPANIMITRQTQQVKLMDFGLVQDSQGLLRLFEEHDILDGKDFADDLDVGMIAGTPEYMAPEQISDPHVQDHSKRRTDTTADVYSLGVIFYQVLTGRALFASNIIGNEPNAMQLLGAYLDSRLKQRDEDLFRPEEVDGKLWTVVAKALRRNPKLRQWDARMLAADIQHFLETGMGISDDEDVDETLALDTGRFQMMELAKLAHVLDDELEKTARDSPLKIPRETDDYLAAVPPNAQMQAPANPNVPPSLQQGAPPPSAPPPAAAPAKKKALQATEPAVRAAVPSPRTVPRQQAPAPQPQPAPPTRRAHPPAPAPAPQAQPAPAQAQPAPAQLQAGPAATAPPPQVTPSSHVYPPKQGVSASRIFLRIFLVIAFLGCVFAILWSQKVF